MSEIKHILQQITALSDVPDPAVLKRLIDELRVSDKEPALANHKMQDLIDILRQHPEYADGLSSFVLKLIIEYRQIALYTDTGIMSDQGFLIVCAALSVIVFYPAATRRFCHRIGRLFV